MEKNNVVPTSMNLYLDPVNPQVPADIISFQQDGASPHFRINGRQYLSQIFSNRWIGNRESKEWPARCPDLTILDFFLWEYVESIVYETKADENENSNNINLFKF